MGKKDTPKDTVLFWDNTLLHENILSLIQEA